MVWTPNKIIQLLDQPLFSAAHIQERLHIFNQIYQNYQESLQNLPKKEIQVYVKGGSIRKGQSLSYAHSIF